VASTTEPIQSALYCIDPVTLTERLLVFLYAAAAADSRRLTRSLALSARPKARIIR
jgi:hypothetical protein